MYVDYTVGKLEWVAALDPEHCTDSYHLGGVLLSALLCAGIPMKRASYTEYCNSAYHPESQT